MPDRLGSISPWIYPEALLLEPSCCLSILGPPLPPFWTDSEQPPSTLQYFPGPRILPQGRTCYEAKKKKRKRKKQGKERQKTKNRKEKRKTKNEKRKKKKSLPLSPSLPLALYSSPSKITTIPRTIAALSRVRWEGESVREKRKREKRKESE